MASPSLLGSLTGIVGTVGILLILFKGRLGLHASLVGFNLCWPKCRKGKEMISQTVVLICGEIWLFLSKFLLTTRCDVICVYCVDVKPWTDVFCESK